MERLQGRTALNRDGGQLAECCCCRTCARAVRASVWDEADLHSVLAEVGQSNKPGMLSALWLRMLPVRRRRFKARKGLSAELTWRCDAIAKTRWVTSSSMLSATRTVLDDHDGTCSSARHHHDSRVEHLHSALLMQIARARCVAQHLHCAATSLQVVLGVIIASLAQSYALPAVLNYNTVLTGFQCYYRQYTPFRPPLRGVGRCEDAHQTR